MEVRAELWTYYKRKSDGKVAVRIRVNLGQDWKHVPDRAWYINVDDWSDEFAMVKPKVKDASNMNAGINATILAVQNYYRLHPEASLELLLNAPAKASAELARMEQGEQLAAAMTFWEWSDEFLARAQAGKLTVRKKGKRKGQPIKPNTVKSYRGTLRNLKLFHERRLQVDWHTIDKKLYEELLHFLRFELKTNESRVYKKPPKNSEKFFRPRRDNAVGKDVKNFRALLGWAMEDLDGDYKGKFPEITAHTKSWFMVPEEDISKYVPEPEERDAIFDLDLTDRQDLLKHQDRAIMSYYFLQRFGDSMDIDESNFYTSNKIHYLRYTSEKTKTPVEIPIKPRLWEILKRNKFRMPAMSNQEANAALKELGQLAGLNGWHVEYVTIGGVQQKVRKRKWQCLTTHTFRRLGATDMDEAGVLAAIIMALGGWATEEQMRDYIAKGGRRARRQAHIAAQHTFFQ